MFRLENLKATSILERYPSNIILRQILKEYVLQEFTSKVFFTLAEERLSNIVFLHILYSPYFDSGGGGIEFMITTFISRQLCKDVVRLTQDLINFFEQFAQ